MIYFPEDYVVLDLETTGLSPYNDEIINIAAIRYIQGEKVSQFVTFVKPRKYIPEYITELTGISDEMVEGAPSIEEALKELQCFLDPDDIIVGHNVSFDIRFLNFAFEQIGVEFYPRSFDTCATAKKLYPELNRHKLADLIKVFKISEIQTHQALDDCIMCNACLQHMKEDQDKAMKTAWLR